MIAASSLHTERLSLNRLSAHDSAFIFRLLNTDGWIRFIGDRNIKSVDDATAYIEKISSNENIIYWTVAYKGETIGIVTLIQRTYLPNPDIGFAFLPQFSKQGFAYEAVSAVMQLIFRKNNFPCLLATTLPENTASTRLLEKLGFRFEKELNVDELKLHLYSTSTQKLKDQIEGNEVSKTN